MLPLPTVHDPYPPNPSDVGFSLRVVFRKPGGIAYDPSNAGVWGSPVHNIWQRDRLTKSIGYLVCGQAHLCTTCSVGYGAVGAECLTACLRMASSAA